MFENSIIVEGRILRENREERYLFLSKHYYFGLKFYFSFVSGINAKTRCSSKPGHPRSLMAVSLNSAALTAPFAASEIYGAVCEPKRSSNDVYLSRVVSLVFVVRVYHV